MEALAVRDQTKALGANAILPDEFRSVEETVTIGEKLLRENEQEEAEDYFHLAWTKGKLLEMNLAAEKLRLAEAARLKAGKAESEKQEGERQEALRNTQYRRLQQQAEVAAVTESKKKSEKVGQSREKPLPLYHTVKRGETLPQIAAQPEVYNDQSLWPLLYRANRDQIRDPGHIWPGQVLRISRIYNREEAMEARRYGQEKPLR